MHSGLPSRPVSREVGSMGSPAGEGEIVRLRCDTCGRGFADPAHIFPTYTDTITTFAKKTIKKPLGDQTRALPAYRHQRCSTRTRRGRRPRTTAAQSAAGTRHLPAEPPLPRRVNGAFCTLFSPCPASFFTHWCLPLFQREVLARLACQKPVVIEERCGNPAAGQSGTRQDPALPALGPGMQKLGLPCASRHSSSRKQDAVFPQSPFAPHLRAPSTRESHPSKQHILSPARISLSFPLLFQRCPPSFPWKPPGPEAELRDSLCLVAVAGKGQGSACSQCPWCGAAAPQRSSVRSGATLPRHRTHLTRCSSLPLVN